MQTFLRCLLLKELIKNIFLYLKQKQLKMKVQHRNLKSVLYGKGIQLNTTLLRAK